jgi:hypothetical protein
MNLQHWIQGLLADRGVGRDCPGETFFGQSDRAQLDLTKPIMFLSFARWGALYLCSGLFLGLPAAVFGQANYYSTHGNEYAVIGALPGDQVFPDAAVSSSGGFVVWQDNITDGDGEGISARRLDGTLSGSLSTFRVNQQGTNDQENPRVAMLKNGGAVFVWQGGIPSQEQIYARFLTSSNTWLTTTDVLVNAQSGTNLSYSYSYVTNTTSTITTNWNHTHTRITGYSTNTTPTVTTNTNAINGALNFRINPAIATLNNSNLVVVWGSFDQAGSTSLQDVYAQILSPAGEKIGGEFLINQFTSYNQRSPAVAALANGGFVVAWVSEQQRTVAMPNNGLVEPNQESYPSVDIYARLYDGNGVAQGGEFRVNTDPSNPCANPAVAAGSDGGFMVAWDAKDMTSPMANSLDIYERSFTSAGAGSGGTVLRVNSYLFGDQYAPRISSIGADYFLIWTSLAQDGSREGVFGQFLQSDGAKVGGELRVNSTTASSQMQPVVVADGASQFLVVWSSYTGIANSFDLFAQRFQNVSALLQPMAAPFVYAPFVLSNGVYQPQLQVSWAPVLGIAVSNYEVYVDGISSPAGVTTNNVWLLTANDGLTASSAHSFMVDYTTVDGRRAPISLPASGATWGGSSFYGIPDEWMAGFFGGYYGGAYHTNFWPSANTPLVAGGPTLYQVFLSGGNPLDSSTWLVTQLSVTSQGLYLAWNTQPGQTYQVQVSTSFGAWSNLGAPRFAATTTDSIYCGGGSAGYYRVLLLRQ